MATNIRYRAPNETKKSLPSKLQKVSFQEQSFDRPQSALARGIQITSQTKALNLNPCPLTLTIDEAESPFSDYLSPRKLHDLTGNDDLADVEYLELKVNTQSMSLGNFGSHLPNLQKLRVSDSYIPFTRDLGTSLTHLAILWMSRCALVDLEGISSMTGLRELYVAYNEINDVTPLSMLDNLSILDLEGNNIDDIVQIEYLGLCTNLRNLALQGNPICTSPLPDSTDMNYNYRATVGKMIPQLEILDDETFIAKMSPPSDSSSFHNDWKFIHEVLDEKISYDVPKEYTDNSIDPFDFIRDGNGRPVSSLKHDMFSAPSTASSRKRTPSSSGSFTPLSLFSSSRSSGFISPPSTIPSANTSLNSRAQSCASDVSEDLGIESDISDLASGEIVCGNLCKSLRRKKNRSGFNEEKHFASKNEDGGAVDSKKVDFKKEVSLQGRSPELNILQDEVKGWKMHFQKKFAEIESLKAPQILKIEHDAETASYSNEEVSQKEVKKVHETRSSVYNITQPNSKDMKSSQSKKPIIKSYLKDKSPAKITQKSNFDLKTSSLSLNKSRRENILK